MRSLFVAILGMLAGWFVYGLITQDFNGNLLTGFIIGILLGYKVRKDDEKRYRRARQE